MGSCDGGVLHVCQKCEAGQSAGLGECFLRVGEGEERYSMEERKRLAWWAGYIKKLCMTLTSPISLLGNGTEVAES